MVGAFYIQAAISGPAGQNEDQVENSGRNLADSRGSGNAPEQPDASPSPSPSPAAPLAQAAEPAPALDRGEDFAILCNALNAVPAGSSPPASSCRVTSYNGFSSRIEMSCASAPQQLSCQFNPRAVTPTPNGTVGVQVQIASTQVAPGNYVIDVVGRSGNRVNSYPFPIVILPPAAAAQVATPQPVLPSPSPPPIPAPLPSPTTAPEPTFSIACTLAQPESPIDRLLWSLTQGSKGTIKCLVTPRNGFDEEVTLSVANVSDDVPVHAFEPSVLQFVDGTASFVDLNFELEGLETGKEYIFDVTGTSASKTLVKRVVLTITE